MFTEKCFIRKNTAGLRRKLRKIGYTECMDIGYGESYITIDNENDEFNGSYDLVSSDVVNNIGFSKPHIDCGDNEDLFLAIAARRDDTDYMQFFVTEAKQAWVNIGTYSSKGSFELCLVNDRYMGQNKEFCNTVVPAHKATVEELIEHFK